MVHFVFDGHGGNVVGSLGSGSMIQDMPAALSLVSGNSNYVDMGDDNAFDITTGGISFSAWMKPTDLVDGVTYQTPFHKKNAYRLYYNGGPSVGEVGVQLQDVGSLSTSGLPLDAWTHVMVSWDGTSGTDSILYYQNGVLTASGASVGTTIADNTEPLRIGYFSSPTVYSDEKVRDVRLWAASGLTAAEVTEVFEDVNMNGGTATGSLVGWWKCDEGTGATITDYSASGNNGTISGTPTWDKSEYNLNQIGSGSLSGAATISGGTWNLRDSTYTNLNGTSAYYNLGDSDNITPFDDGLGSNPAVTYSIWFNCTDGATSDAYMIANQKGDGSTNMTLSINRDDTGSGDAGQISGFLYDDTGTHVFTAYDAAANDGLWHNVVYTTAGTTQVLYFDGVEVDRLEGKTFNNQAAAATPRPDMIIGAFGNLGEYSPFDGDISAVIIDDKAWTAAQVDLYYKGQWVGDPAHWFKFSEGAGNAEDSGRGSITGQQQNATWVKPDYDMLAEGGTAGALVTITGAKLSAPQGELQTGQVVSHLIGADTYIHNSGTLILDGNTGAGVDGKFYDYGNAYYNITKEGAGYSHTFYASTNDDTVVENTFDFTTSNLRMNNRLNMGTTGSRGTILISAPDESSALIGYNAFELYGVSKLYPVLVTASAGGGWSIRSTCELSNIEVDFDWVTRGGGYNHYIMGDCKFAGLDITTTDLLHASGQRLEIGGFDSGWGGSTCNFNDSLVYLTDRYDSYIYRIANADTFYATGSTFVMDMDTAANALGQMQGDQHFDNVAIVNDGLNIASHTLTCTGNLMIAAGGGSNNKLYSSDGNSGINVSGNVSIATDALYEPDDDIATIRGDFNVAGGFIGYGALDLDGVDEYVSGTAVSDIFPLNCSGITMEGWFKTSNLTDSYNYIWRLGDEHIGFDNTPKIYHGFTSQTAGGVNSYPSIILTEAQLGSSITDGKWHHTAFTWASGNAYADCYWDGKLVGQTAMAADQVRVRQRSAGSDWGVGNRVGDANFFEGNIARVSVWKQGMTEAQIRQMMFYDWAAVSGSSIDQTKCVQWYEFSDDQNSATINDMSGSGNTGTLQPDVGGWAGEGDVTVPSANPSSKIVFDNDGGTCNYIFGVDAPTYTHGLDFRTLEVASGTSLVVEDVGTYGSPYFWCSDRHLRLMSGSTISGSGVLNLIRYRQEGGAASGSIYAEEDTSWGNFGFYMDGNNPLIDMPASSSTVETFTLNTYINISDSTNMHLTKDTTIIANDGLYTGRNAHTTLTEGKKLICNRVRPHSGDTQGNAFSMEAGSTIQFTGSSGFADGDDNSNSMYRVNTNGDAAVMFKNVKAEPWPFEGQVSLSGTLPASMDTATLSSGSISYWCKTTQLEGYLDKNYGFDPVFSFKNNANGWGIIVSQGGSPSYTGTKAIKAYIEDVGNSGYSWQSGVDIGVWNSDHSAIWSDTGWNHLMMTFEVGELMQLWVNGVGYASKTYTDAPGGGMAISGALDSSDGYISMGARGLIPLQGSYLNGSVADVRIYHKALTSGNMVTLYNGGVCAASSATGVYPDADDAFRR